MIETIKSAACGVNIQCISCSSAKGKLQNCKNMQGKKAGEEEGK